MPNLASALKDEISRLARKQIKAETGVTKRASAQYRRDIAELKRLVADLKRRVEFLERQEKRRVIERPSKKAAEGVRFSARWLKVHRERLGISAADYGRLVGVSSLTIYNWESGKAKPRKEGLAALAAVRGLGKREVLKRLEMLGG
ncbi:MAG: helix-turn-helix domain-containing protein [Phycisphaerae bacterium]|nr:helix-turn-helix domain-containing protein [Phycisphaerae bacterium]